MELSRLMLSNMHLGGDLQVFLLQIAAPRAHLRIRHESVADVPAAASSGTRRIIVLFSTCMKQTKRVILK
jgi:hypothetical protein